MMPAAAEVGKTFGVQGKIKKPRSRDSLTKYIKPRLHLQIKCIVVIFIINKSFCSKNLNLKFLNFFIMKSVS